MTKEIGLPPEIARAFMSDLREYLSAETELRRDEIAARQRHVLLSYMPRHAAKLRIADVRELFERMRDAG
jgi:hypothetical protein